MKYTISWQKKRTACSFKYHPWHKAVKKLWVTYSVARKALGAGEGDHSTRTRETDMLSSGGMGEPSAICSPTHAQATTVSRLTAQGCWDTGWETLTRDQEIHWIRASCFARTSSLCSCGSSWVIVLVRFTQSICAPPSCQPVFSKGWLASQVKHASELGQSECVRGCLCSCLAVSCGPFNLHCLSMNWNALVWGETHGAV